MGWIHPDLSDLGNMGAERQVQPCSVGGSGMDDRVSSPSKLKKKKAAEERGRTKKRQGLWC